MISVLIATAALLANPEKPSEAARRPNILFLLTDDQRPDTIAALGNPVIQTPNLDRLVRRGMVMSNAYCLGSNVGAVCLPSRNMILSGRSYFRYGSQAEADKPNWPRSMNDAGYQTFHHGKRGNSAVNIQALFQVNRYLRNDDSARRSGEPGKEIADSAIDFLQRRSKDRPFFMYLAFEAPHDPRVAHVRFRSRYQAGKIPLPANFLPQHPFDNGELRVRDELLAAFPRSPEEIRTHLHDYYSVITGLDEQIGRILDFLAGVGELDNTIVVFASDQGLAVGSHGLMGKQNLYEHSARAPLVIAGPGISSGRSDALVYLMDLFPTICQLCGIPAPEGIDGISFAGLLDGSVLPARPPVAKGSVDVQTPDSATSRTAVFLAYRDVQRAIRKGHWKLIVYPKNGQTQLFDLAADPDETVNLSALPQHAGLIAELYGELKKLQGRFGDPLVMPAEAPISADRTPNGH